MKRGCLVAVAAAGLLLVGGAAYIYFSYQSMFNPSYHGKRVYGWAEQAIHDPDPNARARATQELVAAFKELKAGEPRVQLVMLFCGRSELPKEVTPFLVEAMHDDIIPPNSYPALALSSVEGTEAAPALVEVILHDDDPHARAGALEALRMMGERGKPVEPELQRVANEGDGKTRRRAEEILAERAKRKAER
jgi:hypothetical protein